MPVEFTDSPDENCQGHSNEEISQASALMGDDGTGTGLAYD